MADGTCVCGHTRNEHGDDLIYRNGTACTADDCACSRFEKEEEDK